MSYVLCGSYLHRESVMLSERSRCESLITEQPLPSFCSQHPSRRLWKLGFALTQPDGHVFSNVMRIMLQLFSQRKKKKKGVKLNPRTSLLPRQPNLFLYLPQMNNCLAQVGRPLFHIGENISGETWNHGKLPLSGNKAKTFPPSCLLRSEFSPSLLPTGPSGPARPTMKGFLSCFFFFVKRSFFLSFQLLFQVISHLQSLFQSRNTTWQGVMAGELVAKTAGIIFVLARPRLKQPKHIMEKLTRYSCKDGHFDCESKSNRGTLLCSAVFIWSVQVDLVRKSRTDKTKSEIIKTLFATEPADSFSADIKSILAFKTPT